MDLCKSDPDNDCQTNNDAQDDFYTVLFDYKALHEDELNLQKGSRIRVLSRDFRMSGDEGWWVGMDPVSLKKGIFPLNYVTKSSQLGIGVSEELAASLPPRIEYAQLEFGDCIGAGGFGKVFKGRLFVKETGSAVGAGEQQAQVVAIKEARVELGDQPDMLKNVEKNFLQEAKLFWMLRHPNIIQLKGICVHDQHFCLVMEYAKGGPLNRILNQHKNGFPPDILIKWALQVSHGMYYLHEQALPNKVPIIHRDLKSSNILLNDYAQDENDFRNVVLKLTDFGLARELNMNNYEMTAAGTYSHMPPEVIKSSLYSKASDVWSFGVLLWELLTGEIPYRGIDPLAIAYGVAVNKLTLPIPSTCPQIFSDLIHGCWHKEPDERLSFDQIIACLTEISNSPFATMNLSDYQEDWKSEIHEMFMEIKNKETELRIREEELQRISEQQRQRESMLRQLERELVEREKDLVVRELSVALQQINSSQQSGLSVGVGQPQQQQVAPEPKKRRVGLIRNFLRSSSSNSNTHQNSTLISKSIDISTPSDFQHFLSIQPDLIGNSQANLYAPTEPGENAAQTIRPNELKLGIGRSSSQNNSNRLLYVSSSDAASPNPKFKIVVPTSRQPNEKQPHHKRISPNISYDLVNDDEVNRQLGIGATASKAGKLKHQNKSYQSEYDAGSVWYNRSDESRSDSLELFGKNGETHAEPLNSPTSSNIPINSKKISKIVYEIGNILSYFGLGKEYKQAQQAKSVSNTNINSIMNFSSQHQLTIPTISKTNPTRRSQTKKQTAQTLTIDDASSASSRMANFKNKKAGGNLSIAKTPASPSSQVQIRVNKTYPYRFKSLNNNESDSSDHESSKSSVFRNEATTATAASSLARQANSSTMLSPSMGLGVANPIAISSDNLLNPITSSKLTALDANGAGSSDQTILKLMQKKYSKSVDSSHMDTENKLLGGGGGSGGSGSAGASNNMKRDDNNQLKIKNTFFNRSVNDYESSEKAAATNGPHSHHHHHQATAAERSSNSARQKTASPLIPRRNDLETLSRFTIHRQQRVSEQSPTKTMRASEAEAASHEAAAVGGGGHDDSDPFVLNRPLSLDINRPEPTTPTQYKQQMSHNLEMRKQHNSHSEGSSGVGGGHSTTTTTTTTTTTAAAARTPGHKVNLNLDAATTSTVDRSISPNRQRPRPNATEPPH